MSTYNLRRNYNTFDFREYMLQQIDRIDRDAKERELRLTEDRKEWLAKQEREQREMEARLAADRKEAEARLAADRKEAEVRLAADRIEFEKRFAEERREARLTRRWLIATFIAVIIGFAATLSSNGYLPF